MHATSTSQFEAAHAGAVPSLEKVRAGVWALPLAMPHPTLRYVLSYILIAGDGRVHVIDPGWASDENWSRVLGALQTIGVSVGDVDTVTMTHLHVDHIGLAERYREASGAGLVISRVDQAALSAARDERAQSGQAHDGQARSGQAHDGQARGDGVAGWGVPEGRRAELVQAFSPEGDLFAEVVADQLLDDGDVLPVSGRSLRVVATPGHTRGSICIVDEEARLLFTGDTVLPDQFAGLGLGGPMPEAEFVRNPVAEYLESLEKLRQFAGGAGAEEMEVLPGHGWRFTGLGERLEETAEHHERRTREAASVLAEHPEASVWQVAEALTWSSGWQNLHGPYLRSALAQTAMHLDRVRQI